jgi:hypothetical protein
MNYPGFIGGSYQSRSVLADQERTINYYVEQLESPGSSSTLMLCPTPGFTELNSDVTIGPGRAHIAVAEREFMVINTGLYEMSADATTMTLRGTVALDANPATISYNGTAGGQLFITSGGNGYCYDMTTDTLSQITDLNGLCTMGDFVDGYFLAMDAGSGAFYISALNDGTSWAPGLDFARRSIASDPWRALRVQGRYIWLMGEQTSEIWYNSGGASFPFEPNTAGAYVPFGIAAQFSAAVSGDSISWLATTKTGGIRVCRAVGLKPEDISTFPIQQRFGSYSRIDDAVGDTYSDAGHSFYILHFPTEHISWAWDAEVPRAAAWTERGTWNPASDMFDVSQARWHVYAWGEHRWLDAISGSVHRMDSDVGTDVGGLAVRRMRRAPCLVSSGLTRNFFSAFELDLEVGLGLTSGQGSNPQVMLRYSNDGGRTWSREMWRSAGKRGAYQTSVKWNRLGSSKRGRVFEVTMTDPVPWRITNAYVHFAQQPGELSRGSGSETGKGESGQ